MPQKTPIFEVQGMLHMALHLALDTHRQVRRVSHLKESECGQTGVNSMAGTLGCTMDPPAATE